MKSKVSSKGQITLPRQVRQTLGLVAGTRVEFDVRPEGVLLRKGTTTIHPVDRVFGRLKLVGSVDRLVDAMRGPRPKSPPRPATRRGRTRS